MSLQRHDRQERNQIERQDNSICEQSSPGSTRHGYTATNEGCQRILNTMTVIHAPQRPARARRIVRDRSGGSVWESNLPFTDIASTYEEALGRSWKDLAFLGTPTAALLLPRFLIPLFSHAEPFQQLCCWLFAWRQALLVCK